MQKLIFKESYTEQETTSALIRIDSEIKLKKESLKFPERFKKITGPAFTRGWIKDLENWRAHYLENTFV
jgi:hypothetical protein